MRGTVHQITSGVAGWLTYEQMRKGTDNLTEASLYRPIEDIARGRRGFEVRHEFSIPKISAGRGGSKEVDFVIVNRGEHSVLALEVKYKKQKKELTGTISADATKLNTLTIEAIDQQILAGKASPIRKSVKGFSLTRAVIVVWREGDLVSHIKRREKRVIRHQFLGLVEAMLPDGVKASAKHLAEAFLMKSATRPVGNEFGSLRSGSTITNRRFWVASFVEMKSWRKIGN